MFHNCSEIHAKAFANIRNFHIQFCVCVCVSRQEEIESPLSSFIESILQLNTDLNFCAFICYACHSVSFFFLFFGTLCMNVCVFGLFSSSTKEKNVKEGAKSVWTKGGGAKKLHHLFESTGTIFGRLFIEMLFWFCDNWDYNVFLLAWGKFLLFSMSFFFTAFFFILFRFGGFAIVVDEVNVYGIHWFGVYARCSSLSSSIIREQIFAYFWIGRRHCNFSFQLVYPVNVYCFALFPRFMHVQLLITLSVCVFLACTL